MRASRLLVFLAAAATATPARGADGDASPAALVSISSDGPVKAVKTGSARELVLPVKLLLDASKGRPGRIQARVTLRYRDDAVCPAVDAGLEPLTIRAGEGLPGASDSGWFDVDPGIAGKLCLVGFYAVPAEFCSARVRARIEFRGDGGDRALKEVDLAFGSQPEGSSRCKTPGYGGGFRRFEFRAPREEAPRRQAASSVAAEKRRAMQDLARGVARMIGNISVPGKRPSSYELTKPVAEIKAALEKLKALSGAPPPGALAPSVVHAAQPKRPSSRNSSEDRRLANTLYFEALRDYGRGSPISAVVKLRRAARLAPEDADIAEALDRARRETAGVGSSPADGGELPSLENIQAASDLYFEALKRYGKGEMRPARALLLKANALDPSDGGLLIALRRIDRELAGALP